jgi:hypothetical protein
MIRSLTFKAIMPVVGKSEGVRVIRELIDQILAWCREFKSHAANARSFLQTACRR